MIVRNLPINDSATVLKNCLIVNYFVGENGSGKSRALLAAKDPYVPTLYTKLPTNNNDDGQGPQAPYEPLSIENNFMQEAVNERDFSLSLMNSRGIDKGAIEKIYKEL